MSDQQPFVPAWAADALSKATATDLEELSLLREFFDLWEQFHALPDGKKTSKQGQAIGADLMNRVAILRRFRTPNQLEMPKREILHLPGKAH